jgi:hypothetical protein
MHTNKLATYNPADSVSTEHRQYPDIADVAASAGFSTVQPCRRCRQKPPRTHIPPATKKKVKYVYYSLFKCFILTLCVFTDPQHTKQNPSNNTTTSTLLPSNEGCEVCRTTTGGEEHERGDPKRGDTCAVCLLGPPHRLLAHPPPPGPTCHQPRLVMQRDTQAQPLT